MLCWNVKSLIYNSYNNNNNNNNDIVESFLWLFMLLKTKQTSDLQNKILAITHFVLLYEKMTNKFMFTTKS